MSISWYACITFIVFHTLPMVPARSSARLSHVHDDPRRCSSRAVVGKGFELACMVSNNVVPRSCVSSRACRRDASAWSCCSCPGMVWRLVEASIVIHTAASQQAVRFI